MERRWRLAYT